MPPSPNIGDLVKEYRKKQGLNQSQCAEKFSMSRQYLSDIETGKEIPGDRLRRDLERWLATGLYPTETDADETSFLSPSSKATLLELSQASGLSPQLILDMLIPREKANFQVTGTVCGFPIKQNPQLIRKDKSENE